MALNLSFGSNRRGRGNPIRRAIAGFIFGILFFAGSFALLFWNEGRAIKTHQALEEGRGAVVSIDANQPDAVNDGAPVHLSGLAETDDVLEDPEFEIAANAIRIIRSTEMYQWEEDEDYDSETSTTTYRHSKTWSSRVIDSSGFHGFGHDNPSSMPFGSLRAQAREVNVGAFSLSGSLIGKIEGAKKLNVGAGTDFPLPERHSARLDERDGGYYIGADPGNPSIGDVRIRFTVAYPNDVSVIARQQGSNLATWTATNGHEIELLSMGIVDADSMFAAAIARNRMITWAVRFGGFALMFISILMIFSPLTRLTDRVPIVGGLLNAGVGLFSLLVSGSLSLVTISLGWLTYRPLIGGPLLVGSVGLLVMLKVKSGRAEKAGAPPKISRHDEGPASPPPPPPLPEDEVGSPPPPPLPGKPSDD